MLARVNESREQIAVALHAGLQLIGLLALRHTAQHRAEVQVGRLLSAKKRDNRNQYQQRTKKVIFCIELN